MAAEDKDLNREPLSDETSVHQTASHPVGTGIGAVGGAMAGAAAGAVAGPAGMAAGGAIGAVVGALAGHAAAEAIDPEADTTVRTNLGGGSESGEQQMQGVQRKHDQIKS